MKRKLKWLLGTFLFAVLLFTGGWQYENWRGERAWEKALSRAEEAGVSLDYAAFERPEISDEENLLRNEAFLAEWNGGTEPHLDEWHRMGLTTYEGKERWYLRCEPVKGQTADFRNFFEEQISPEAAEEQIDIVSKEIQERIDRFANLVLSHPPQDLDDYEGFNFEKAVDGERSINISRLHDLAGSLRSQSILALRRNMAAKALRNIKAIHRLARNCRRPGLVNFFVARSLMGTSRKIIWEGIRTHAWNQAQLEELGSSLKSEEPIKEAEAALRFHLLQNIGVIENATAFFTPEFFKEEDEDASTFDDSEPGFGAKFRHAYATGGPQGWTLQRKSILVNSHLDLVENLANWHLIPEFQTLSKEESPRLSNPFFIARELDRGRSTTVNTALRMESSKRIALIAIAAEQHYLKAGSYPVSLGDLETDFDITDTSDPEQRALAYQLDKNGRPEIWSLRQAVVSKRPRLRWQFWEEEELKKSGKKKRSGRSRQN